MVTAGCEKADLYDTAIDENKDAQVELTINGVDLIDGMTRSYSLTDPEEKQIKALDVLVFNSSGNIVTRTKLINPLIGVSNKIITKSGSGMSVYVVANATTTITGNGTPNDPLGMASNVNVLEDIKITNMFVDIQNNKTLVMYGLSEDVIINPDGSSITSVPITLNYFAAKFTANIYSSMQNGDNFELVDWKIGDLANADTT